LKPQFILKGTTIKLLFRNNSAPLAGFYEEATDTIYVSSGLPPLIAECVYLHEREHQKCYLRRCKCYFGPLHVDDDCAEYHAHKGELVAVLERDSVALAQAYLKGLAMEKEKIALNPRLWRSHNRAVARIERLIAYRQVQNLAKGRHNYSPRGEKK